ncbi:hypothetical protein PGT21_008145 [Puccinia graminis f. sp. tritici]|uniref:Uncharacterized protein n=1 Tax=Puccinia graminis f. sp. tritici TaxID=56615 RepID=A0A5B0PTJ6_PUCGR|nr:hypothetical protein PGT21_008145 [Puccinia graminis f. sp. tritici]
MKLATLITFLSLASHIQGRMRSGEFYPPDNRYTALQYVIALDKEGGNIHKPSKINYHMSDEFTRSDNRESVRCIFSVESGEVHINNPFDECCYACVFQDGALLEDKNGKNQLKHFNKIEQRKYMGSLQTPRSSKETKLQVQYWVMPPVEKEVTQN